MPTRTNPNAWKHLLPLLILIMQTYGCSLNDCHITYNMELFGVYPDINSAVCTTTIGLVGPLPILRLSLQTAVSSVCLFTSYH